jgi:hypothetical protein
MEKKLIILLDKCKIMLSNIVPYTIQNVVTSFSVVCAYLDLFNNATFTVRSCDINGNVVKSDNIEITSEEYLQWNNNDEYIIQLMATKLGYILQP